MSEDNIICLLPDSVCNQIAAGEVVQRPSSVVKELLENSIDACSTEIKLVIKNGGKTLIQVVDNGVGMSDIDARMSLEKHATSKIKTVEDLYSVKTMGFRGEAVASIISVSQCDIITRKKNHNIGTRIIVEGSVVKSQEQISAPVGTNFIVKNLFFNLPARRVFLKSDDIETQYIIKEFQNIALSRHDISFIFISDNNEKYNFKSTSLLNRILDVLGYNYKGKLLKCQDSSNFVSIDGFVGDVSCVKRQKIQYMFVNNRYIKNQYLQKAISVVYESLIQKDKHPLYVIFLSVKPEEIDVNIHPTKTEVKFHYEETIYEILKNVVMKTLSYVEYPKLDFDGGGENIFDDIFFDKNMIKDVSIESNIISNDINNNCNNNNILNSCLNGEKRNCTQELISNLKTDSVIESQNTNFLQVKPYYILTTVKSGLLIINFHLAHVRILYEMYLDYTKDKQSQQLLFPIFVNVDSISYNNIKRNVDLFTNYGFSMEFKNNNSILITSSPIYFDEENIIDFFDDSFDILNISKECEHDFVLRLAQKSAINKNKIFTNEEMQVLINRLFSCKEHDYTPNGEKIWKILKSDDIERILR